MKNAMKKNHRFLIIAALALAGAMAAGCSELEIRRSEQANDGKVTLTTTLCFDDSDATKALTAAGVKTFAAGDRIAVIYKNTCDETVKAVSAALAAGDIYAEGKKATISVTLTDPAAGGALRYIYPAAMAKAAIAAGDAIDDAHTIDFSKLQKQDGTLATIATKYDLAVFDGTLTGTATLPESATLENRLAIGAFTVTDSDTSTDVTSTIKQLTVSDGSYSYVVDRTAAAGPIYVAMKPFSDRTVSLTAVSGTKAYRKSASAKTFDANKLYPVDVTMEEDSDRATPLTIEAKEAGATVTFNLATTVSNNVEYRIYGTMLTTDWTHYTGGTPITLPTAGDRVMFRGENDTYYKSLNDYSYFTCSQDCYIYGNIMSLVSPTGFATATELTGADAFHYLFAPKYPETTNPHIKNHVSKALVLPATKLSYSCYASLFSGCTGLTEAPKLPATTLAKNCYYYMFRGCTGLTTAPELPATTMAESCYEAMFLECVNLTAANCLPATTLAEKCYFNMFYHCSHLTAAPDLPATTLAPSCYSGMFRECSDLETAPVLPATTLAISCYSGMFSNCSSLKTAPNLPAPTLVNSCYGNMFYHCTNLSSITCAATDISAYKCTYEWLYSVAGSGSFTTPSTTAWTMNSEDGIPSGWTRIDMP